MSAGQIMAFATAIAIPTATPARGAESAPPAMLAPSGKWSAGTTDMACEIGRRFGQADDGLDLYMRLAPGSGLIQVDLQLMQLGSLPRKGPAIITIFPSGKRIAAEAKPGEIVSWQGRAVKSRVEVDGGRRTTLHLARFDLTDFEQAQSIEITGDSADGEPVKIRLGPLGMGKALSALTACETDFARRWGFDATTTAGITKYAEASTEPASWITQDDYPRSSSTKQGTTVIRWTIGVDGRAHDCTVLQSSGAAALDKTSCAAIERRARYRPAIGANGKPTISFATRTVTWRQPGS